MTRALNAGSGRAKRVTLADCRARPLRSYSRHRDYLPIRQLARGAPGEGSHAGVTTRFSDFEVRTLGSGHTPMIHLLKREAHSGQLMMRDAAGHSGRIMRADRFDARKKVWFSRRSMRPNFCRRSRNLQDRKPSRDALTSVIRLWMIDIVLSTPRPMPAPSGTRDQSKTYRASTWEKTILQME